MTISSAWAGLRPALAEEMLAACFAWQQPTGATLTGINWSPGAARVAATMLA